jgi:tRNA dimethylallyltransferase
MDLGLGDALTSKQAIGYAQVIDYIEGRRSLEEAREAIVVRTRRYAKRQLSWFRRDGRVRWIEVDRMGADEAVDMIVGELALRAKGEAAPEPERHATGEAAHGAI